MIVSVLGMWTGWHVLAPQILNPFESLIFISHPIHDTLLDTPRYVKGPRVRFSRSIHFQNQSLLTLDDTQDLLFIAYYVVRCSLVIHSTIPHVASSHSVRQETSGNEGKV